MSRSLLLSLALGLLLLLAPLAGRGASPVTDAGTEPLTLRVGVRDDARPFAFRKHAPEDGQASRRLEDYDGFTVSVCRTVLKELVSTTGPFYGAAIEAVEVTAQTRFERLRNGDVDLLCGPDSITIDRLDLAIASFPVYLSGISYAYLRQFPGGRNFCGTVVGVVSNTTAASDGLKVLAEKNLLNRFDEELESHLAGDPFRDTTNCRRADRKGNSPVVEYPDHRRAVEALCNRRILYYVGDVDILRARIAQTRSSSPASCDVRIEPFTLSREVYAVLFRRDHRAGIGDPPKRDMPIDDALLYAEFNRAQLRLLQGDNNLLERAFAASFKGFQMSPDLADFFRTMKITRGWKQ